MCKLYSDIEEEYRAFLSTSSSCATHAGNLNGKVCRDPVHRSDWRLNLPYDFPPHTRAPFSEMVRPDGAHDDVERSSLFLPGTGAQTQLQKQTTLVGQNHLEAGCLCIQCAFKKLENIDKFTETFKTLSPSDILQSWWAKLLADTYWLRQRSVQLKQHRSSRVDLLSVASHELKCVYVRSLVSCTQID